MIEKRFDKQVDKEIDSVLPDRKTVNKRFSFLFTGLPEMKRAKDPEYIISKFSVDEMAETSRIVQDNIYKKLEIYKDMNDYMANITPIVEYNYDVFAEMFSGEVNHFYDCVINGVKCKAPAEDGVMLMKILDAIYESALTGHEVKID